MKLTGVLFLIALLVSSTGCTSTELVNESKGYTGDVVQPLKGDTVFLHRGRSYVSQRDHKAGEETEKMSAHDLQGFPPPYHAYKPHPGYYAFLLVTVPFDALTLPFQAIGAGIGALLFSGMGHNC